MNVSDSSARQFFAGFPVKLLAAGELLLRPDDELTHVYYVESGELQQYDIADSGRRLVVNSFRGGAYIPMTAVLLSDTAVCEWFVEAVGAVKLRAAPIGEVRAFLQQDHSALLEFTTRLCSGASGQQRKLLHMMSGKPKVRVLYEIVILCKRFGVRTGNGIEVSVTESQLADHIGLSRETVSRELRSLKQDGVVSGGYKKIQVPSLSALEELLKFEV